MTLDEAEKIALTNLPKGSVVKGRTLYEGKYLFIIHTPDPLEGTLDPFYSVDLTTGYFRDFSPQDYENPRALIEQLTK